MDEDRRREERKPSFEIVEVTLCDRAGSERTFPLMVRDRSEGGLGGVYVSSLALDRQARYRVEEADGSATEMVLKWIQPVAGNVFVLGFQRTEE